MTLWLCSKKWLETDPAFSPSEPTRPGHLDGQVMWTGKMLRESR